MTTVIGYVAVGGVFGYGPDGPVTQGLQKWTATASQWRKARGRRAGDRDRQNAGTEQDGKRFLRAGDGLCGWVIGSCLHSFPVFRRVPDTNGLVSTGSGRGATGENIDGSQA